MREYSENYDEELTAVSDVTETEDDRYDVTEAGQDTTSGSDWEWDTTGSDTEDDSFDSDFTKDNEWDWGVTDNDDDDENDTDYFPEYPESSSDTDELSSDDDDYGGGFGSGGGWGTDGNDYTEDTTE